MDALEGKTAVVIGASRGLGRAVAARLSAQGTRIVGFARDKAALEELAAGAPEGGGEIMPVAGDVTDAELARQVVAEWSPDLVVLSAGVNGPMKPVDEMSWDEFSTTWNTDVKGALVWGQASVGLPLRPGSEVVIVSSGAAIAGSPLSGGYAGAKRTQWFLAGYFQKVSDARDLGIRFRVVLPKRIVGETDLGRAAAEGYSQRQGITVERFLEGFGTPMGPAEFAGFFERALVEAPFAAARTIGIAGDGPEVIEA